MLKQFGIFLITCMMTFGLIGVHTTVEASNSPIQKLDHSVKKIVKAKLPNAKVSIAVRNQDGDMIYDFNAGSEAETCIQYEIVNKCSSFSRVRGKLSLSNQFLYDGESKKGSFTWMICTFKVQVIQH